MVNRHETRSVALPLSLSFPQPLFHPHPPPSPLRHSAASISAPLDVAETVSSVRALSHQSVEIECTRNKESPLLLSQWPSSLARVGLFRDAKREETGWYNHRSKLWRENQQSERIHMELIWKRLSFSLSHFSASLEGLKFEIRTAVSSFCTFPLRSER